MQPAKKPTVLMVVLAFFGVVIAVVARGPIAEHFRQKPTPVPPQVVTPPTPRAPEDIAKPHLAWADEECDRIISEHIAVLDTFFVDAKKNSRAFAEEALSWGSKRRLIVDHVPYTRGGRHEQFIRERFEEYAFKPSQLEEEVRQIVSGYLHHVRSVEGKMLVRLRADVSDFPSAYVLAQIDPRRLDERFDEAVSAAIEAAGSSLRANVATELVSTISGEILTQVAVRMGVSAGILGTGAASSVATLGIGLAVGVIVDAIVSWVWDWYADPTGNLASRVDAKLDEINQLIVNGSDDVQGLRKRLDAFARERAIARRTAVLNLLQPPPTGVD